MWERETMQGRPTLDREAKVEPGPLASGAWVRVIYKPPKQSSHSKLRKVLGSNLLCAFLGFLSSFPWDGDMNYDDNPCHVFNPFHFIHHLSTYNIM